MDEKQIIISHALDMKEKAADSSVITSTNFFSLDELSFVKETDRHFQQYVTVFYYGGYKEAERQVAIFLPKIYAIESPEEYLRENEEENPLCVLRLKKDKFTSLSHRDYLGAIMGLGIKREMIGDIKTRDDGADIFCKKSISGFLLENLKKTGRGSVEGEILSVEGFADSSEQTKTVFVSVASLRLDCLVSTCFGLSRTAAAQAIIKGLIYVNSSQKLKADYLLKEKDKLVFRGKGKVVLDEITGESKKGRVHINIKKYI